MRRRTFSISRWFDHVRGNAHRFHGVDQGPLDRLLDPPGGVGAEAAFGGGVEAFDRLEEPDISFLDEIEEWQAALDIVLGDADDEAQIRPRHLVASFGVALANLEGEFAFFMSGQQGVSVDVDEIGFEADFT